MSHCKNIPIYVTEKFQFSFYFNQKFCCSHYGWWFAIITWRNRMDWKWGKKFCRIYGRLVVQTFVSIALFVIFTINYFAHNSTTTFMLFAQKRFSEGRFSKIFWPIFVLFCRHAQIFSEKFFIKNILHPIFPSNFR